MRTGSAGRNPRRGNAVEDRRDGFVRSPVRRVQPEPDTWRRHAEDAVEGLDRPDAVTGLRPPRLPGPYGRWLPGVTTRSRPTLPKPSGGEQPAEVARPCARGPRYGAYGAGGRGWDQAVPLACVLVLCLPGLVWASRAMRPLGLDNDTAAGLGVRVQRTQLGLTVLGVVLAATATGAAGPIGFVALTAPQLARRLTRTPQLPLIGSALTGAVVVVAADLAARTAMPPLEIPVGALTALVGGPYLLWLLGRPGRS